MQKLRDIDCRILELLHKAPEEGVSFALLISSIGGDPMKLGKRLDYLRKKNLISRGHNFGSASYKITELNEKTEIEKVRCPICKTPRLVEKRNQVSTTCVNPYCKCPSGKQRAFMLVNIDAYNRGEIRHLNRAV